MIEGNEQIDMSYCIDDKNILKNLNEKEDDNIIGEIKKSKTCRYSAKLRKSKHKKSKKDSNKNHNIKKVKFSDKVDEILVESWKRYNLDQTADENFEAFLISEFEEEKENKSKDNDKSNNKKSNGKRDNISCTCNII